MEDFLDSNNETVGLCPDTIVLENFGYDPIEDGKQFSLYFDADSFALALAINMGILSTNDLQIVSESSFRNPFPEYYCNSSPFPCSGLQVPNFQ